MAHTSGWPKCSRCDSWGTSRLQTHTNAQAGGRSLVLIFHDPLCVFLAERRCSVWARLHKHIRVSQINLLSFITNLRADSAHCHVNEGFPYCSRRFSSPLCLYRSARLRLATCVFPLSYPLLHHHASPQRQGIDSNINPSEDLNGSKWEKGKRKNWERAKKFGRFYLVKLLFIALDVFIWI